MYTPTPPPRMPPTLTAIFIHFAFQNKLPNLTADSMRPGVSTVSHFCISTKRRVQRRCGANLQLHAGNAVSVCAARPKQRPGQGTVKYRLNLPPPHPTSLRNHLKSTSVIKSECHVCCSSQVHEILSDVSSAYVEGARRRLLYRTAYNRSTVCKMGKLLICVSYHAMFFICTKFVAPGDAVIVYVAVASLHPTQS